MKFVHGSFIVAALVASTSAISMVDDMPEETYLAQIDCDETDDDLNTLAQLQACCGPPSNGYPSCGQPSYTTTQYCPAPVVHKPKPTTCACSCPEGYSCTPVRKIKKCLVSKPVM